MDSVSHAARAHSTPGVPALEVKEISKSFGAVKALQEASLYVDAGEVLALVGDNGAGKSTMIKTLSGVQLPDSGEIRVDGSVVRLSSPHEARKHGIQTVYQDLSLCENLSVTGNMFLGQEKSRLRMLSERDMEEMARSTFDRLGVKTIKSVRHPVSVMSGGQRQVVAIAKAAMNDSKVVLLDEPTAALGVEQTAMVLRLVRTLAEQGQGVILISHSLPEIFEVADRITVLRLGRKVHDFKTSETTTDEVVSAITGALAHI